MDNRESTAVQQESNEGIEALDVTRIATTNNTMDSPLMLGKLLIKLKQTRN